MGEGAVREAPGGDAGAEDGIDVAGLNALFVTDSIEILGRLDEDLIALESSPDRKLVDAVFRAVHTLKGNAACLGFEAIADVAHGLEDVLKAVRAKKLDVSKRVVSFLLSGADLVKSLLPGHEAETETDASAEERSGQVAPAGEAEGGRTLRVDIGKLDRLVNLAGEISIARGHMRQALSRLPAGVRTAPSEAQEEVERLCAELEEDVMRVRMVPISPLFRSFVRTVRDISESHGKLARLVIEGEDVEVDTAVVEHMRDPLTHMVRNSLDHGIELPEHRKAAGKEPCGTVTLRARHDSGGILIEVEDDGAGLDRARIGAKAKAAGLIAEPERLSDSELFRVLFEPGFTTAEKVTDLSGRGIGLDVVRRNMEILRGSVSMSGAVGRGALASIRLPLTLAMIQGFGVRVAGEEYVMPLEAVVECCELPADANAGTKASGLLALHGDLVPWLSLRRLYSLGGECPARRSVVIVQQDGRRVGLVVDELIGESRTVVKPLGRLLKGLPGISGGTLLGNGRVTLIVDLPGLLARALRAEGLESAGRQAAGKAEKVAALEEGGS